MNDLSSALSLLFLSPLSLSSVSFFLSLIMFVSLLIITFEIVVTNDCCLSQCGKKIRKLLYYGAIIFFIMIEISDLHDLLAHYYYVHYDLFLNSRDDVGPSIYAHFTYFVSRLHRVF